VSGLFHRIKGSRALQIWWRRSGGSETFSGVDYGTALEAVEAIRGIYDAKIRASVHQRG
jgi:hypothetical protein